MSEHAYSWGYGFVGTALHWAYRRAYNSARGLQLASGWMQFLSWHSRRGLHWVQLMLLLHGWVSHEDMLDMTVIYQGENNLRMASGLQLIWKAKRDIGLLVDMFLSMGTAWLGILACRVWWPAVHP